MPYRRFRLALFLFIAAATARHESHAQASGEVGLSDESVQLRYLLDDEPAQLGFGLFLNENRDIVASTHYYVEADRLRFNRLSFKAGPVGYAALLSAENTDVFGVAIGAEVRFEFLRRQEVELVGNVAYAPDILTFGSADGVWDVSGRVEIPLTDRVTGFGGYRLLEIDLLQGTDEIEESLILGVRYRFGP